MSLSRRQAMRLAVTGLGALPVLGGRSWAQSAFPPIPSWNTELRQLAPGIFAYTQATGPGVNNASLSNAGVIAGPDNLLAIDTLGPPLHARAFKALAMKVTGKAFGRVLNTHHHRDHTNGNCFFAPAEIVAHRYTRQAVIEQGIPARPYDDRPEWQDGMNELRLAPPTTTFVGSMTYRYGETVVEIISMGPAHTWGDVVAYLPQYGILFAGDIAFSYVTPPAHNGHVTRWIEAIDKITGMDLDIIVPGHGPIGGKRELRETRAYLELMANEISRRYNAGMRPGQAAADVNLGRFANWTNPERHAWNAVRIYAELSGTIGPATDMRAQNEATAEYMRLMARR
jgi:cyclase